MNLEERIAKARELKVQPTHNCCQAVVEVLKDQTEIPREVLQQAASGFAAGIGNMEGTCGALVGAVMVAGLKLKTNKTVSETVKISEFETLCGATACKDLKGKDGAPGVCSCVDCVENAVRAYEKILGIEERK